MTRKRGEMTMKGGEIVLLGQRKIGYLRMMPSRRTPMYQAFIVATRPYPEKAADDQFHPDLDSARKRQEELNAQSKSKPWRVYEVSIEVIKEIES